VAIDGVTSATSYNRSLDFNTGLHTTTYKANDGNTYTSTVYCSYPDQVCVYDLSSSAALPQITISLENRLTNTSFFSASCADQYVRLAGVTQLGPPEGMKYDGIARLTTRTGTAYCSNATDGTLIIPASSHIRMFSLVIAAGTNYDQKAGDAAHNFSFKGPDPGPTIENTISSVMSKSESHIRSAHVRDYQSLMGEFSLSLPNTANSTGLETSEIISRYTSSGPGDPYLESLLFSLGRHLFVTSERPNSLPTNLAGRWSETLTAAWSADYHANINMQMNHWGADATGLGALQGATWHYMQDTWVPRGTETAKLLYNAPGWVVHDEMNIFGHTGMKDTAQWANYPAAAAWMMQHVHDYYEYSQDPTWFQEQGYPLMKGVAEFWLSQLQPDIFFHDGALVVNSCNSPEHGPTTFACTHYQQLIHQLFLSIVSAVSSIPSLAASEAAFITKIQNALKIIDTGLHIGTWGEVKEWKLPDSYGYNFPNDTHRHLSMLNGWYPGWSISSSLGGYSNSTIQKAVATSLYSRGPGNGPDANAGWEKMWRSACWALLNNTEQAYFELRYAIDQNFAGNGLSMYWGLSTPFQIDANFGLVGATLAMLVHDLPGRNVVLGPAIPESWSPGEVKGLRLRGGGSVDFHWDENGVVVGAHMSEIGKVRKVVNKEGKVMIGN
jgi:alpha-L-fucosidase 2